MGIPPAARAATSLSQGRRAGTKEEGKDDALEEAGRNPSGGQARHLPFTREAKGSRGKGENTKGCGRKEEAHIPPARPGVLRGRAKPWNAGARGALVRSVRCESFLLAARKRAYSMVALVPTSPAWSSSSRRRRHSSIFFAFLSAASAQSIQLDAAHFDAKYGMVFASAVCMR